MQTPYALLLATAFITSGALAQAPVTLTKPDAAFPDPYTRVASVRELPNGKLIIADLQDKTVQMLDFATGQATKIGREGQGPGEYALPAGLLAMPNGETWINDLLGRRFLVLDPTGKPTKTVALPGTGGGPGGMAIGFGGTTSDQAGRVYFQAPPFNIGNPDAKAPDSLAILRWDAAKGVAAKIDTVAWLIPPKGNVNASGGGGRVSIRLGGGKVFTPQEAWGVAGDGAIARVRPSPYQVLWYGANAGTAKLGQPQPYTVLLVTEQDKRDVIEARKRNRPMMVQFGGGPRLAAATSNLPDPEFEDTKPPFTGNNAVLVAPEGEVWVARTRPASDPVPSYDVFDKTGKLVRKVNLNAKSTVIGFGKGTVYVIRTDDDDLQYVERYRR